MQSGIKWCRPTVQIRGRCVQAGKYCCADSAALAACMHLLSCLREPGCVWGSAFNIRQLCTAHACHSFCQTCKSDSSQRFMQHIRYMPKSVFLTYSANTLLLPTKPYLDSSAHSTSNKVRYTRVCREYLRWTFCTQTNWILCV